MTRIETRQSLIKVGTDVIGSHGFNPTGLNTVLKTAGVPKGSFYYYFASKEDFGLAIIDEFAIAYNEKIDSFLSDTKVSPLQRIRNYLQNGLETINEGQCKRGCLIGTLGQELSSQNETSEFGWIKCSKVGNNNLAYVSKLLSIVVNSLKIPIENNFPSFYYQAGKVPFYAPRCIPASVPCRLLSIRLLIVY